MLQCTPLSKLLEDSCWQLVFSVPWLLPAALISVHFCFFMCVTEWVGGAGNRGAQVGPGERGGGAYVPGPELWEPVQPGRRVSGAVAFLLLQFTRTWGSGAQHTRHSSLAPGSAFWDISAFCSAGIFLASFPFLCRCFRWSASWVLAGQQTRTSHHRTILKVHFSPANLKRCGVLSLARPLGCLSSL